jgi:hypothetical protein
MFDEALVAMTPGLAVTGGAHLTFLDNVLFPKLEHVNGLVALDTMTSKLIQLADNYTAGDDPSCAPVALLDWPSLLRAMFDSLVQESDRLKMAAKLSLVQEELSNLFGVSAPEIEAVHGNSHD